METSPGSSTTRSLASARLPLSPWTLHFLDTKTEYAYRKSQCKDTTVVTETWTTGHTGRKAFVSGFAVVWMFVVIACAGCYGLDHLPRDTLQWQLVILAVLGGSGGCLFLLSRMQRSSRFAFTAYPAIFLFAALCYSVLDERFLVQAAGTEYSGSATSCVVPMSVLAAMLPRAICYRFLHFTMTALSSVAVLLGFQLAGVRLCAGLMDCMLYLLFIRVYLIEKRYRANFYLDVGRSLVSSKEEVEIETWVPGESNNSDIEGLLKLLREVYTCLSESLSEVHRETRDRLKSALSMLADIGKGLSALNPREEGGYVSKAVDQEYRIYLEEQYLPVQSNFSHKPRSRSIEYGVKELVPMLNQLEKNWNFDMFFLAQISGQRPLEVTGHFCVKKYGLDTGLNLNEEHVLHFLQDLERKYKPNPYHNSTHAADVLNSMLFIYKQSPIFTELSELELFGSILAALGHDAGHPAFNNRYLINTKSSFALMYNDFSVLEMMHSALTYELLTHHQVLDHLGREQWQLTRRVITELILATDMMRHFELVENFQKKYAGRSLPLPEFDDRLALYKMCMKCADIAHAGKSEVLHEKWTLRVVEEFYHQGDNEKDQGLPVSLFCDRSSGDLPKNQSGFIIGVVRPLFAAVNALAKSQTISEVILAQLDKNVEFWKNKAQRQRQKRLSVAPEILPPERGSATTTVERAQTRVLTEEDM